MAQTLLFVFLGILTVVSSQISFKGKCNNVTSQQNFDMKKYLGTWYEIEKYPTIFQAWASCIKVNYAPGKNNTVHVENSMNLYGHSLHVHGKMHEIHPKLKDGKLKVNYPEVDNRYSEIWVLDTDYSNFSIVWYCTETNSSNEQYAWVLSRTPNITEHQQSQINTLLVKNHLDLDRFIQVNQTHCKSGKNSASNICVSHVLLVAMLIVTMYKLY